jgi:hypothetical protein
MNIFSDGGPSVMKTFRAAVVVVTVTCGALSAQASTALFSFAPGQPTGLTTSLTINVGTAFTVSSPFQATEIGAWVGPDQANGLSTVAFAANLYFNNGVGNVNLITSQLVPIGTPVNAQGFAYVPFSTTLNTTTAVPTSNYWLTDVAVDSSLNPLATPFAYNNAGAPNSAGTWVGAAPVVNVFTQNGSSFVPVPYNQTPNNVNPTFVEFMGANLLSTPEPSTVVGLVGACLAGLVLATRRRFSQAS